MLACRLHNILVRLKNNSLNGFVFVFRYEKKTDCLLRRSVFSHTFTWGDPHTPSVSSSTNEEALLTVQKSQLLMLIRYTHSATVDFSVFVCVCLSVDNSANNSLTSKYCVVALFSLTHKKH